MTDIGTQNENETETDNGTNDVDQVLSQWKRAELQANVPELERLLADDFVGIGPLGFTLPKAAWLGRHRPGGLAYESFDLTEVETRVHGGVAIVTARQTARGTYAGGPIPEAVRASLTLVNEGGALRLAAIHMSFIGGTPGAPALPGPARPMPNDEPGARP